MKLQEEKKKVPENHRFLLPVFSDVSGDDRYSVSVYRSTLISYPYPLSGPAFDGIARFA